VWVNCLKSQKKTSIYPLGKTPSAPSVWSEPKWPEPPLDNESEESEPNVMELENENDLEVVEEVSEFVSVWWLIGCW